MPRSGVSLALGTLSFAAASAWPDLASACTYATPPAALVGYPMDGATDVPTDVIPSYDTMAAILQGDADLVSRFVLRTADGEEVPLMVSGLYHWAFDLTPQTELLPNTTYTLAATLPPNDGVTTVDAVVTFTTGAGRATAPAPVEGAFLEHYRVETNIYSSCGVPLSGTCVSVPEGLSIVATFVDEFEQEFTPGYLWRAPTFTDLSGIDQGTNFRCVNLRTRAPNGVLSDPVSLCGTDGPLLEFTGSNDNVRCTVDGVSFDTTGTPGSAPAASSASGNGGGCTVSRVPMPANTSWLLLPMLLGVLGARRGSGARAASRG